MHSPHTHTHTHRLKWVSLSGRALCLCAHSVGSSDDKLLLCSKWALSNRLFMCVCFSLSGLPLEDSGGSRMIPPFIRWTPLTPWNPPCLPLHKGTHTHTHTHTVVTLSPVSSGEPCDTSPALPSGLSVMVCCGPRGLVPQSKFTLVRLSLGYLASLSLSLKFPSKYIMQILTKYTENQRLNVRFVVRLFIWICINLVRCVNSHYTF